MIQGLLKSKHPVFLSTSGSTPKCSCYHQGQAARETQIKASTGLESKSRRKKKNKTKKNGLWKIPRGGIWSYRNQDEFSQKANMTLKILHSHILGTDYL